MKKIFLSAAACVLMSISGFTTVTFVPDDHPTILQAIQASTSGDTILVKPGTYAERINFDGKNLIVASLYLTTGDSSYIDQTIISGSSQGSVVTFAGGETEAARLVGFTIRDGIGTKEGVTYYGGGIYCSNANPTLENLTLSFNIATGFNGCGGGAYFRESTAKVIGCRFLNNEAKLGSGVRTDGASIILRNCWFEDNFASSSGGGAYFNQSPEPRLEQCVFTGNQAAYGGAIACYESGLVIDRITSFLNHGGYGGTLHAESNSNIKVINSIFWENSLDPLITNEIFLTGPNQLLVAYSDILGSDTAIHIQGPGTVNWMEGNIELYPEFNNPVALDLTLSEFSPCIDAGTPLFIHNSDTLVYITDYAGTAPEMGAYEFPVPVSSDPFPGSETQFDLRIQTNMGSEERVVTFTLPEAMQVRLALFDLRGRKLARTLDQNLSSGFHSVPIHTATYPTGIYILQFLAGDYSQSQKFLIN